jgi:hypothetical protein
MSPLDDLHRWEEMMCVAGLLPRGDIPAPNEQLQVEWFYMTFHKSDRAEYVQSGRKLSNKMLQTVMEYFQSIHETCEHDGSLTRHQVEKIRAEAKCKLHRKLEERLGRKQRLLSDQHRGYRLYDQRNGSHHCRQHCQRKQRKLRDDGSCGDDKRDNRKSTPAKTRTSSPVTSTASMPSTHTKSAMPTHTIKQNCPQTTTSAGTKVAITTTIATQVAMMSRARALILPCPATAKRARATRAKLKRTFT